MTLIVYTCITHDYDWLLPPIFRADDVRHICFTDRSDLKVRGWEIRPIEPSMRSSPVNLIARHYKFMPWDYLPEHDWSLWVDANIRILQDPRPLIEKVSNSDVQMLVPAHVDRTDIRDEYAECVRVGKIRASAVQIGAERLADYFADGFPDEHHLFETGIIFRRGDATKARPAMEMWWKELDYFAGRDQISLPYVAWRTGLSLEPLGLSVFRANPFFAIAPHHRAGQSALFSYLHARQFHGKLWRFACFAVGPRNFYYHWRDKRRRTKRYMVTMRHVSIN